MKYVQFRKLNGPFPWFHFINFKEIECPEANMKEIQENWTSPKLPPFFLFQNILIEVVIELTAPKMEELETTFSIKVIKMWFKSLTVWTMQTRQLRINLFTVQCHIFQRLLGFLQSTR